MKNFIHIVLIILLIGIGYNSAKAQNWKNWRKIVPLVSTCEDVKKIFNVEKCEYPYTKFDNSEWRELKLSEKNYPAECDLNAQYKGIAKGTVLSATISNIAIPLKDFESDLSEYEVEQVYDLPNSFTYKNKKTGVEFEAFNLEDVENTMVVGGITLHASAENAAKFGCSLQWKEIKPFVSTCEDLERVFKIDKCTFPTTKIKTARFNLTVDFPKNVCGKKCRPKTNCWKVSRDTIVSMLVESPFGGDDFTLKDFDLEWDAYAKEPVPYLPDLSKYTSEKKGIELEVYRISNTIYKLRFFPSAEDKKKYKCEK